MPEESLLCQEDPTHKHELEEKKKREELISSWLFCSL
jgi:hypothetical protein